jgi:hypothetical protein
MKPAINSAHWWPRLPPTEDTTIDRFSQFWPRRYRQAGDAP